MRTSVPFRAVNDNKRFPLPSIPWHYIVPYTPDNFILYWFGGVLAFSALLQAALWSIGFR